MENNGLHDGIAKLERAVLATLDRLDKIKTENKDLREEVNELRRLLAISEKKAERLKLELERSPSDESESWRIRERAIKQKLKRLATKLTAFEKSCTNEG